jgi:hypothetical protein
VLLVLGLFCAWTIQPTPTALGLPADTLSSGRELAQLISFKSARIMGLHVSGTVAGIHAVNPYLMCEELSDETSFGF